MNKKNTFLLLKKSNLVASLASSLAVVAFSFVFTEESFSQVRPKTAPPEERLLFKEEVHQAENLAEQGNLVAQFELGRYHLDRGDRFLKANNPKDAIEEHKKAYSYFARASQKGHLSAKTQAALLLMAGKGVERNTKLALDILESTASQGDLKANFVLGNLYLFGQLVEKNEAKGYQMLSFTAMEGNLNTQRQVGLKLLEGWEGQLQDLAQASIYLSPLAKKGDQEVRAKLKEAFEKREMLKAKEFRVEMLEDHPRMGVMGQVPRVLKKGHMLRFIRRDETGGYYLVYDVETFDLGWVKKDEVEFYFPFN